MRTSAALIGLASAVMLLASACGGGEDQPSVTPPATPASAPIATAAPSGSTISPVSGWFSTVLGDERQQRQADAIELSFELEFLVDEKPDGVIIDQVAVLCEWGISFNPQARQEVRVEGGQFQVEFTGVVIEGRFVSQMKAEGTIRALSGEGQQWLEDCKVPEQRQWAAERAAPSFGQAHIYGSFRFD